MDILPMTAAHWLAVQAIYTEGVATGNATFVTEGPAWAAWDASPLATCHLMATDAQQVLGWAAFSPVSNCCVCGGAAEVSVYVGAAASEQGVGRMLLAALVAEPEQRGLGTLQAGSFPENNAILRLHGGAGLRVVGLCERNGQLHRQRRDTLLLKRRSSVVGTSLTSA
jgi:L-amino acid N-acyltransferase YncA